MGTERAYNFYVIPWRLRQRVPLQRHQLNCHCNHLQCCHLLRPLSKKRPQIFFLHLVHFGLIYFKERRHTHIYVCTRMYTHIHTTHTTQHNTTHTHKHTHTVFWDIKVHVSMRKRHPQNMHLCSVLCSLLFYTVPTLLDFAGFRTFHYLVQYCFCIQKAKNVLRFPPCFFYLFTVWSW
jgi:hypothetical protein